MAIRRVLKDSTETLVAYPTLSPDGRVVVGVPTAATVRVGTTSTAIPTSGDSATIDSVNTTVTAAASEGDTTITTASATYVAGVKYLVQDAGRPPLVVESAHSATGTTLYLKDPLPHALTTSATVKGIRVSHALTTSETSEEGPGIAVWTVTVGGVDYVFSDSFRVVRRITQIPLTVDDLIRTYPVVLRLRERSDVGLDEVIASAWEYRVLHRLAAKGVRDEDIVDAEVLRPLLALACVLHLVALDESADPVWRDSLVAEYERTFEATFGRVDWYEHTQDADPAPSSSNPDPPRVGFVLRR